MSSGFRYCLPFQWCPVLCVRGSVWRSLFLYKVLQTVSDRPLQNLHQNWRLALKAVWGFNVYEPIKKKRSYWRQNVFHLQQDLPYVTRFLSLLIFSPPTPQSPLFTVPIIQRSQPRIKHCGELRGVLCTVLTCWGVGALFFPSVVCSCFPAESTPWSWTFPCTALSPEGQV